MSQRIATIDRAFRDAVIAGLTRRDKRLPCKYLYDEHGSALFDQICELPEYYLTRTEVGLLERIAPELARQAGSGCRIVEFGAGSSRKIRILLAALDVAAYIPVDVSRDYLLQQVHALGKDHPGLAVHPVCADFMDEVTLPALPGDGRLVGFFPGSTIGNLSPGEAHGFLTRTRRLLGDDGLLVIGADLQKDVALLQAAYDDAAGVTARFTLNLLARINRELGGGFALDGFEHRAQWDAQRGCIAIHIVSRRAQTVRIDGTWIAFAAGEAIHVEDSHKYTLDGFRTMAAAAGWRSETAWVDDSRFFSIHCLRPARS